MRVRERKKKIFSLITVSLALVLVNILSKIILIIFFDENKPYFFQFDAELGWRGIPNKRGTLWSTGKENKFTVWLNSDGFRDNEFKTAKTPGITRIAFVGDSFVWGYGVEQRETIPAKLKEKLKDVEVYNFGMNGFSTDQEYLLIKNIIAKYNVDIIILSVSFNDLYDNTHLSNVYSAVYNKPTFTIAKNDQGKNFLQLISKPNVSNKDKTVGRGISDRTGFKRLALGRLILEGRNVARLAFNPPDTTQDFPALTLTREVQKTKPLFDLFRTILQEIKNFSDQNKIKLVTMLVTDNRQIHQDKIDRITRENGYLPRDYDLSLPNRNLTQMSQDLGIPVIDLYPIMVAMDKNGTSAHYEIDVHYNARGTDKAAEVLAAYLVHSKMVSQQN